MNWNVSLLIASIVMMLLMIGVGLIQHVMMAETIAESLAPQIGVDEDIIRSHVRSILQRHNIWRTVVYCSPLAFLSLLLMGRLIADVVGKRRRRH